MRAALLAAAALLAWPAGAHAAPALAPVGSFDSPVHVAAPPGDPARLFVVEQGGRVQLVKAGAKQAQPYADLGTEVLAGGERGLLSIAFPPDYAVSGLAYVYLTAAGGEIQIRELQRSANPDRAVAGPGRVVLAIPHTEAGNHNGGQLAFGPGRDALRGRRRRRERQRHAGLGRREPRLAARQDPAHRPAPGRRAALHRAGRQPVRHAGVGIRAAQPVALLVRSRDGRPARRRRRPGRARGDRRDRAGRRLRLALLGGDHPHPVESEQPQLGPAVPGRDAPYGADPRARPRRRLLLDHRRRGRARSRCADPRRALSVRRLLRSPACARRCRTAAGHAPSQGSASARCRRSGRMPAAASTSCRSPGRSAGCRTARRRRAARRGRRSRRPHPRPRRRAPPTCARAGSA